MALEKYRTKRDFAKTSEPEGGKPTAAGNSFVIQKHAARRLHYDFRLELDGVLKSWAVAKGPSLVAGEKRLAVHVEDHPLDYGDFEGTIPKGEYGGGTVIVWDRGTWTPDKDPAKAYAKGHLDFELHGEKLGGKWHLVRMGKRAGDKNENWLLIKSDDDAARPEGADDILEERPESVKTGRTLDEVAGEAPGWSSKTGKIEKPKHARVKAPATVQKVVDVPSEPLAPKVASVEPASLKGAKKGSLPTFIDPALATLVTKPPAGERWIHEIKFDGYRLQVRIEAGRVKLLTRSGLDWTAKFGNEIVSAFKQLPLGTALIDGELVVESGAGASDFSALQSDLSDGRTDRFIFYAFDLLYLDGYDLRAAPLIQRKDLLGRIVGTDMGKIRFSGHFDANGDLILKHACRLSLEGIVSKITSDPYRSGRGKGWVKSKCSSRQEMVVGGFVPSSTSKNAVGSLVLGVYNDGKLEHVGRVGTGFTNTVAEAIFKQLDRIKTGESPFAARLSSEDARLVQYVRPELVAEIEFRAWTGDGHLRHASFRGIREDKDPTEIVRETPKQSPVSTEPKSPKRTVTLTHPDRVYWPDEGVTKEGLADYYTEVWRHIAPHIVGRPLSLLRCPNGINGQQFFQKHAWKGLNKSIVLVRDPQDADGEPLISVNDLDGLLGLVQASVLEIHPWGSMVGNWEKPDMIIMDLDPGPGVTWPQIIAAAEETRQRLAQAGLASYVKTSGGKGLHVVAPLKPKAEWPAVKAFTKAMADQMAADSPERFVSTVAKAKRPGKILVDYLRNGRGQTAVAAYSTRARPGASVSMPLAWEELSPGVGPAYFTTANAPTRLATLASDPWAEFKAAAVPLEAPKPRRGKAA
ncbi:DNA ligase D [Rhizobium sp. 2YAF20]|uniref:DNA ligase D n=1 Tax=Rhizobium sp. 2YAF20 TaxID=3233027 RepID=UPI003F9E0F7C